MKGVVGLQQAEVVDPEPVPAPTFDQIYHTEFDYVWNTLRRLDIRETDLEDLTHDVFVAVYRRLADYDPSRPVRSWLFGFAFREASNYRRSARFRRETLGVEAVDATDARPAVDEQILAREEQDLVAQALGSLDELRWEVFVRHELEEQSAPDIARDLGIPLNTAYSRLRLAREHFVSAVRRIRRQRGES